jgi:hypothetical protein
MWLSDPYVVILDRPILASYIQTIPKQVINTAESDVQLTASSLWFSWSVQQFMAPFYAIAITRSIQYVYGFERSLADG